MKKKIYTHTHTIQPGGVFLASHTTSVCGAGGRLGGVCPWLRWGFVFSKVGVFFLVSVMTWDSAKAMSKNDYGYISYTLSWVAWEGWHEDLHRIVCKISVFMDFGYLCYQEGMPYKQWSRWWGSGIFEAERREWWQFLVIRSSIPIMAMRS